MQKIIDMAHYQTVTSWSKIANNVDAVILKATQGHALSSKSYMFPDKAFHKYAKAAIAHGIPLGVYHFFTGSTEADAVKEADYFCEVIAPYRDKIMLAVCDAENYDNKWLLGLSRKQLTDNINAFCARVKAKGYPTAHYTNVDHINSYINAKDISYPCWCASYGTRKPTAPNLIAWQYTSEGRVPGISTNVDVNHGYFSEVEFAIFKLQAAGVIDTPLYWLENYDKLKYIDELLIKAAEKIGTPRTSSPTKNIGEALKRLSDAGVINTPEYWQKNHTRVKWLTELILKLGGSV